MAILGRMTLIFMAKPGQNILLGSITADSIVGTVVSIGFQRQQVQHHGIASPLPARRTSGVSPLQQEIHYHATGFSPSGSSFRQTLHTSPSQNLPSASLNVQTRRPFTHQNLENRPLIQPIYKQVEVGYPVDAQVLEEHQRTESHRRARSSARQTETTTVDSSFLHQSSIAVASRQGLASIQLLLNDPSPSSPDSSSAVSTTLSPIRVPNMDPTPQPKILGVTSDTIDPRNAQVDCSDSEPPTIEESPDRESNTSTSEASFSTPAIQPRMGTGERRLKRRTTDTAFVDAVRALSNHIDDEVKRMASEFKRSLLTVKKLMGLHRRFRERKAPSLYNALLHRLAQKRRACGNPLGKNFGGQHQALMEDEELQDILQNPSSPEAHEAIRELTEYQEAKFRGTRASAKANDNDIVKTWGKIANTYLLKSQSLSHRTSAATFGFVCSSKPGQNVTRQFFGNGPIEAFVSDSVAQYWARRHTEIMDQKDE
ncbi:hypothetical protein DFJ43DRAFT_1182670 [Lentinula guzmanii]|uniref:Uncharacterized protein n=1 Tax=Lentinula guzmanii TaxID=2804957 RepID=A0AA38JJ34_9AGAR|nr:hypothetical protein DFJ43DRAFT_1182670 [Lentinula guzmanii]